MDGPSFLTPTVTSPPETPIVPHHLQTHCITSLDGTAWVLCSPELFPTNTVAAFLAYHPSLAPSALGLPGQTRAHQSFPHSLSAPYFVLSHNDSCSLKNRIRSSVSLQCLCKPHHSEVPLLFVSMRNCKVQRLVDLPPLPLPNIAFTSFHIDGVGIYLG